MWNKKKNEPQWRDPHTYYKEGRWDGFARVVRYQFGDGRMQFRVETFEDHCNGWPDCWGSKGGPVADLATAEAICDAAVIRLRARRQRIQDASIVSREVVAQ